MNDVEYTGMEFLEGFFLLCGALWVLGALFFISLAAIGGPRAMQAAPAVETTQPAETPAA